jgi:hypothetical protein
MQGSSAQPSVDLERGIIITTSMSQVPRLLLFLAFLLLVVRAGRAGNERRRTNHLVAFVLSISLVVAVSQKDAWPFSPHPVLAEDATRESNLERVILRGVDAEGGEWEIDPLAFSPLPSKKVTDWLHRSYPSLGPGAREEAVRFLLERAESARHAASQGRPIGRRRLLGPLTAPEWMLHKSAPAAERPFVGLRGYEIRWQAREVLADPSRVERILVFDTTAP